MRGRGLVASGGRKLMKRATSAQWQMPDPNPASHDIGDRDPGKGEDLGLRKGTKLLPRTRPSSSLSLTLLLLLLRLLYDIERHLRGDE